MTHANRKPRDHVVRNWLCVTGLLLLGAWASPSSLVAAEVKAAQAAQAEQVSVTIPVEGMLCFACAGLVKSTVGALAGVSEVNVDLTQRAVRVKYAPAQVSPEQIIAAINDLGYKAGGPLTQ